MRPVQQLVRRRLNHLSDMPRVDGNKQLGLNKLCRRSRMLLVLLMDKGL